ncbi:MAG TPA: tryptophan-rich sensory protein, partial [Desulfitobacteriaceae bacterium]|nr:tryptophan-rich sensory protein [Desulfitobacteriaceae bacterium]
MTAKSGIVIKVITAISFLVMIVVNALAIYLPINGLTQAQVSDSYKNLFAPAGITFSIWGIIYLLLAGYTLYQTGLFQADQSRLKADFFNKVGVYFSITSLVNAAWLFSWSYHLIPLSLLLMLIILICLVLIIQEINKNRLMFREKILVRLPFSIYFGWITVATIANATVLLVSLGWDGFGISEANWTVIIIFVGLIIGCVTMLKNKDIAYGLVIIWAYAGILYKHMSASGFAGQYPTVIAAVAVCIIILFLSEI